MMNKQSLVVGLLLERLADSKVGILVKGINGIQPDEIAAELSSQRKTHIYMAAVGYGISTDVEKSEYTLTPSIEKAVLWRSVPEYAGNIVVFVKTDTDKLHSLAEFDVISLRDVSKYLLELQISNESNAPTQNFWRALQQTSDYYSFEAIMEFVQSISNEETVAEAIPNNMWRLNLLCDADILGTKYKPSDRLTRNRELIFAIGQLSEDSRKKLSRSLAKTEGDDRIRLQNAYNLLQNLYKYGKRDILKQLDFATVQELFSASKANESKKKKKSSVKNSDGTESDTPNDTSEAAPIRPKELGQLISDAIVNGDENDAASIKELLEELKKHFDPETEENNDSIPTIGGVFDDRTIVIENHQSDLRRLVGTVCNPIAWGGLMETEESVLKDAISADIKSFNSFNPVDAESMVAFHGGIDGSQSLFDFIKQFDAQFKAMQLILSSSKLEDFIHFEGLPHLYSGRIISDATEATKVIKEVIFEESERRGRLLAEARVANIVEYNKKVAEKLAPIVVVIDEFADLADQLETTKEKNAFYKPVQRIAQAGRSRGIHLVICTQRPEAKLVPSTTKAQLNGRVALRVNDGISSRMIIEEPDAQYLQKHGDMIYRNGDIIERAQGYLIEIEELDKIVDDVIHGRI